MGVENDMAGLECDVTEVRGRRRDSTLLCVYSWICSWWGWKMTWLGWGRLACIWGGCVLISEKWKLQLTHSATFECEDIKNIEYVCSV